jgi:hypothetical protein
MVDAECLGKDVDQVTKNLFTKLPAPVNVKARQHQQASISEALRSGARITEQRIESTAPQVVEAKESIDKVIEVNANDLRGGENKFYDSQLKAHSIQMFKQ